MPLALALISFAVLLYELLLTRVFSVVLLYHFAYVALALALMGFSVGAMYVFYRPALHAPARVASTVILYGAGFGLTIVVCTLFLVHFRPSGVDFYGGLSVPTLKYLFAVYVAATLPFLLAGVCVSVLLAAGREAIGRYYSFDLLGAALGALAVIPVLNALGAPSGMLVAAVVGSASGLLLLAGQR